MPDYLSEMRALVGPVVRRGLTTYRRAFRISDTTLLVGLGLDPEAYGCDGPVPDRDWTPNWFKLDADGRAHHVGFALHFVDAADFDGDGSVEVVFWTSRYNRDGYVLYDSDLHRVAEFVWNYH